MGDKKPSIRTLPSGEKVMHYPDGSQRLMPQNKAARFLAANREDTDRQSAELDSRLLDAVAAKREALDAGDAVPHDKRPI
jgi:hypothetical protein